ncbi:uncharacterized protein BDFB_008503, partial [Asbolus verrucosus]
PEGSHKPWSPSEDGESALSRSMRYADPWLYGSVRAPGGLVLAPAFVLCACGDYVNGTKRSSKKSPITCKKCKGTRLPFSAGDSKFGTARCYPSSTTATPLRAGTMRVVSSSSRPSILPSADPYDLMRRSRLSVSENTSQFRARSISPSKVKSNESRSYSATRVKNPPVDHFSSPSGRRSILECDINPYELMSTEPELKDASITLVNGQRIRVRPPSTNSEYEDVQVRRPTALKRPQVKNKSPQKLNEKESECNRFKSILKKRTTFSDTDSNSREHSPSPAQKSGSHFYLPMPSNTPRKKVQFLVENELECQELINNQEDDKISYVDSDCSETPYPEGCSAPASTEEEKERLPQKNSEQKVCKLRRSVSERFNHGAKKVVFHDTMALRSRAPRNELRISFGEQDLERLDGLMSKTRRKSPTKATSLVTQSKQLESSSSPVNDHSNKTVVQINGSQTVHKLQIKNEFTDVVNVQTVSVLNGPQRKTSIMITGDDCYSTVNVNDDVPLYQSSVVVKDTGMEATVIQNTKKSSSVYITSNFINSEIVTSPVETKEHLREFNESIDEKNVENDNEMVNEDYEDCEFNNTVENKKNENNTLLDTFSENNIPSSELLKQLLRDPVEAVRRNLVPHVCGKSDVLWRRRDKKFLSNEKSDFDETLLESSLENINVTNFLKDSFLKLRNYESVGDDLSSEHSSSTQYELMDASSECYTDHSNRSSVTEEELANRTKFYELLADSAVVEVSESEDHHYESIKINSDPIYEEIEIPPPLPTSPPPLSLLDDLHLDKEYTTRSIFEGASKYDILSYLVDAKERGIVQEDNYTYNFVNNEIPVDDDAKESYNRVCHMSTVSDSSEDNSLILPNALIDEKTQFQKTVEVERNDSGLGSETSKSSLSKYRTKQETSATCEDCETVIESLVETEPLICRKCLKKRSERKEIITEIVETEEKYSRDLQIILEEFYQPMLVAGLLTPEQLSAIFLNVEELLENSQSLAERLRDAVEIAIEQGDEDLLTVNIGKLFLEAAPMLHGFETYCVRQGAASLLLASLEKEKELLRIFLRVSQMENTMLRRMNLNSFLMVPVQRVTKYPLLLARLYKVTPVHHETKEQLKEAQHKIELHLNHMNSETKDVPSKLWRRIGSSSGRRSSTEMDLVNIKLRKIAVDVLEWNHDEAKFALEGKLLFTQPTDNNWRKGRTIKLTPVNALLVTNGK